MPATPSHERGFSLVELLVAMVVTLLIAGGIFGLLYDSNRTFGREPAVSEQQQNARIAMSLIESDLFSAGAGGGPFTQVFTNLLDDTATDSTGVASPLSVIDGGSSRADALELRAAVDECASLQLCKNPSGASVFLFETIPSCMKVPGLVIITDNAGHSYTRWACKPGGGAPTGNCTSGGGNPNGHVTFPAGAGGEGCTVPGDDCNNGGDPAPELQLPAYMTAINKVRYEVRAAADGVPSLWRSPTGGSAATASGWCDPDGGGNGNDWQLVARGIEDLQVRYRNGNTPAGAWDDIPGTVACQEATPCTGSPTPADYATIVREVEVRLSARVITPHAIQGESTAAGGPTARRSELRTVIAPRAAIMSLQAVGEIQ